MSTTPGPRGSAVIALTKSGTSPTRARRKASSTVGLIVTAESRPRSRAQPFGAPGGVTFRLNVSDCPRGIDSVCHFAPAQCFASRTIWLTWPA